MNFPERHGNRWTKEEENRLLQELGTDTIEQCAVIHKRSVGGVKAKLKVFVREFYQAGMDIEDIVRKTRLSEEDVFDALKRTKKDNKVKIDKLDEINDKFEKILKILQNLELV